MYILSQSFTFTLNDGRTMTFPIGTQVKPARSKLLWSKGSDGKMHPPYQICPDLRDLAFSKDPIAWYEAGNKSFSYHFVKRVKATWFKEKASVA